MDPLLAEEIAVEAYAYLYPLLLMDATRLRMTNVERAGNGLQTPVGTLLHIRSFPPGDFKGVVRPNFDTLYTSAFLELGAEPLMLSVPAAGDLYYLLPMYDMFGEVFASPGSRTTGNDAQTLAIVGPGWEGVLPEGVITIRSPHRMIWIIGRTQASAATYGEVHAFQDAMTLTPLSAWPGPGPEVVGVVDADADLSTPPLRKVFALDASTFFREAADLLRRYPAHVGDQTILMRMARIGMVPGQAFDLQLIDPEIRRAIERAVPRAQARIRAHQSTLGIEREGWRTSLESMGSYGQDYLRRATVELAGLGANLPDDSIYPASVVDAEGRPYDGSNRYVLHFAAGALPPVRAFWSLTAYDDEGFTVSNVMGRYAISDRDELMLNADGSLDVWLQHDPVDDERSPNWLPVPEGRFNLLLRLYEPRPEALDGTWSAPGVFKLGRS